MEMKDIVIIGGGPAGLAAGLYAARAALDTVLIEQGTLGGQAAGTERIENYPGFEEGIGGPELTRRMDVQARRFGLNVVNTNVQKLLRRENGFAVRFGEGEIITRAVILASGTQPGQLGVKGEAELHGLGVSFCATCDGAFFKGRTVAVVGGGDAAVEEAMFLTRFAEKVYVIHRRGELRATKILQERAKRNPRIEFIWHSVVSEILGAYFVEGLRVKNVQSGAEEEIKVDGVFLYVGTRPNAELVGGLVKLDAQGYVITDEKMATSCPGLFAAGDVRRKILRQVVTAVADGATAAVAAEKYLESIVAK
ncbi:MAG: thioredoxin-disulfide reductase [Desulfotomaculaceae bacterium]|nr:thioredoxin-disulfide reductase [Desulfotomaculaceae bacterium]